MEGYCGHILVENGRINNIDLGGRILRDGVYSIIQESINKQKKEAPEKKEPAYDMEGFVEVIKSCMSGREQTITMNQLAREIGMYETTLIRRIKENHLLNLFKLKKPAEDYMDY